MPITATPRNPALTAALNKPPTEELRLAGPARLLLEVPDSGGRAQLFTLETITDETRLRQLLPEDKFTISVPESVSSPVDSRSTKVYIVSSANSAYEGAIKPGDTFLSMSEFARVMGVPATRPSIYLSQSTKRVGEKKNYPVGKLKGVLYMRQDDWENMTLENVS